MNRVLDRLYIGDASDLDGTAPLQALGFSGVVDLCGATSVGPRFAVDKIFRLSNRDGDPWNEKQVRKAVDFIHDCVQHGRVLVACAAGMSRSSSVVVGYLVRCGWSAPEAFALVKQARPRMAPVASMLKCVLDVVGS